MPRLLLFILTAWLCVSGADEEEQCEEGDETCSSHKGSAMLQSRRGVQHATTVSEEGADNKYGWAHSFQAGDGPGQITATEIMHVVAFKGKLFAATGHWMDTTTAPGEIMRLDSPGGTWVSETRLDQYAPRAELLKAVTWTHNQHGNALSSPQHRLYAAFYLNYLGEGRGGLNMRNDAHQNWDSQWYWKRRPYEDNKFSARCLALHHDTVTGADLLLISTGVFGLIGATYNEHSSVLASFPSSTESGSGDLGARPLALIAADGRAYVTAGSKLMRRTDGSSPSWSTVFDMASIDSATVDEAVGGLRGLTAVAGPSSTKSLLFVWSPNGRSQGCFYRLDPSGDSFTPHGEGCLKQMMRNFLGKMSNGVDQKIPYVLAAYNDILEIEENVHLAGFQALLWGRAYDENPVVAGQAARTSSGQMSAYYAGAGFVVRRGAGNYEVRTPYSRRWTTSQTSPELVAVRSYALSPFHEEAVYMAGWDCNFFSAHNTGWVMRGTYNAVFREPVPCYPEDGCPGSRVTPAPTPPPTPAPLPTPAPTPAPTPPPTPVPIGPPVRDCSLCPEGSLLNPKLSADAQGNHLCSSIVAYINSADGASVPCSIARSYWGSFCCEKVLTPDVRYVDYPAECTGQQLDLTPGTSDANTFRCMAGWCISMKGRCNGHANCGDASDEDGC